MSNRDLEEQIGLLLATLTKTSSVDAETRDLLIALQRESARLTSAMPVDDSTVTQRLEEIAVRFEAEHPAIGTAIRQTIDTLVRAGI